MSPSQECAFIQGTASVRRVPRELSVSLAYSSSHVSASLVYSSGHVSIYCKKILALYLTM